MAVLSQRPLEGPMAWKAGPSSSSSWSSWSIPTGRPSSPSLFDGARSGAEGGLLPPGVWVRWATGPARPPVRRLQEAAFVGYTVRGPLFKPLMVESWGQFVDVWGGFVSWSFLAYAAAAFFENGGERLWVVRIADNDTAAEASLTLAVGRAGVKLVATSRGRWGNDIFIRVSPVGHDRFDLELQLSGTDEQESWQGLPCDARRIAATLNGKGDPDASDLVSASVVPAPGRGGLPVDDDGQARLHGGEDGLAAVTVEDFSEGLGKLAEVPSVAVLAMPDIVRGGSRRGPSRRRPPSRPDRGCLGGHRGRGCCRPPCHGRCSCRDRRRSRDRPPSFDPEQIVLLQNEMILQCERLRSRIALLDPYPELTDVQKLVEWREGFDTSFAACYAPWIEMPDPLHGADVEVGRQLVRAVPPSGHVAGVLASVALADGPAKPPANVRLAAARALTGSPAEPTWGHLNNEGINLIRAMAGRGLRVMGARTVSRDPVWRFLNVRRLMIFLETRLEEILLPLVFENQTEALWETVERLVGTFLDGVWRRGWLAGETAGEAYFVRCDETTNPPDQVDAGRLTVLVGVRTPWPVEQIFVLFGFTEGGLTVFTTVEQSLGWP